MSLDGRIVYWVFILLIFGFLLVFDIAIPWYRADNYFVNLEYHGVVDRIEHRSGYHDVPHIQMDGQWRLLTKDEAAKLLNILEGDSIAKERGSRTIRVFRLVNGNYQSVQVDEN